MHYREIQANKIKNAKDQVSTSIKYHCKLYTDIRWFWRENYHTCFVHLYINKTLEIYAKTYKNYIKQMNYRNGRFYVIH